jgi:drug/metabolite transporter (DMT)-like permease
MTGSQETSLACLRLQRLGGGIDGGSPIYPSCRRYALKPSAARLAAFGVYAIVACAMTQAPIRAVAVLRECSVVFAAIVGGAFLSEPFRGARVGAALLIVGSVISLRLA